MCFSEVFKTSYTFNVLCILYFIEVPGVTYMYKAGKYSHRDTGSATGAVRR